MPRKITKEDYYKWTQHSLTFFGIAAWLMKEAFKYMWLPTASNKMTLNWTTLTELYLPIRLIFIIVAHFQLVIHFCWVTHSPLVFRFASQVEFDRPIFTVGLNFILPNHIHFHRTKWTSGIVYTCIHVSQFWIALLTWFPCSPIENNIYNHFISHSGRDHRPCATVPEIFCQRARYCLLLNRISEVNMCSTNYRIDQLMSISAGNTALRHSAMFTA